MIGVTRSTAKIKNVYTLLIKVCLSFFLWFEKMMSSPMGPKNDADRILKSNVPVISFRLSSPTTQNSMPPPSRYVRRPRSTEYLFDEVEPIHPAGPTEHD